MTTAWLLIGGKSNNRNTFDFSADVPEPDTASLGSMLGVARHQGYGRLIVSGGEPTLRRDMPRFVEAARALGIEVVLATNARIFSYQKAVDAYVAAGIGGVLVTLCGPDAAIHDGISGAESFNQTVDGVRALRAAGVNVAIDVPVCTENVGCLAETAALALALGASSICFRLVEARSDDRLALVPDLRLAAASVTSAVRTIDSGVTPLVAGYADFPCCLLPDLKGREIPGPRADGAIRLEVLVDIESDVQSRGLDILGRRCGIIHAPGGQPSRAMPVPCAACELRGGCSTVEEAVVRVRGSGELHLPIQSAAGVCFTRDRVTEPVIRDGVCPHRDGVAPAPIDCLFLVTDAGTELWKMSAGQADPSILMHTKNIRNNLVMASSWLIPTLDPVCRDCENLSRCAAVFHVPPADSPIYAPVVPIVSSVVAGRAEYLKWPDFAAGFADFLGRSGDSPVSFEGGAPVVTLLQSGAAAAQSPAVEPLMLWEAARKAAMCELVDYSLPYGPSAFVLDVRRSDRWAQVDRMGTILIIRKCTMNCIICQVQKFYEGIDIMPLPDVVRFLEEFRLLGYTRLDLFGGEPTMRRDLVDLVGFAHRLGFYTDLITNGTLMDDVLACRLRDAGLDLCIVSLDGPTPEIHDRIRRVRDGHEKAVAGIRAVVRAGGMEVNVDTVVLPDNIDHLIELARQVAALGVTRINMFLCLEGPISSPVPRLLGFDSTVDYYERILPEMRRIGAAHGTSISVGPRLLTAGRPLAEVFHSRMFRNITEGTYNAIYNSPEILCKAPDDEVYVSLFGDVFPCTAPQMLESSAKMGNAYRDKLIDIVRSEKWAEFKKISGHHEGCRMCWRAHFDLDMEGEERVLGL